MLRNTPLCLLPLLVLAFVGPLFGQEDDESGDTAKDALVWAVSDLEKVNPLSGNLLSEGPYVYKGRVPSKGHYRERNSVWDSSTRTIKLNAGRNEFVSFQLVIERQTADLHKVFVNVTDLLGAKERICADRHVRLFRELYLQNGGQWYPDALLPFELAGTTPFEIPDYSAEPQGQRVQTIWADIYVPHDLPAGTYSGQVIVVHRNTNRQAVLNLEVEVAGFTLPDKLGIDVDLMNYGFLSIERGWPDLVQDSPRHHAIEREFFRMAHAHRMTFSIVPYNHDGSIPKGQKPELAGVGDSVRVSDWSSWDARYGPVLSGEAFADLPRGREPVSHFFLPNNLMWPSDMRNWKKPRYREETVRIAEAFRKHLAEKGWTKPLYQIYYNHKQLYGFYPWNLDEPTRPDDLDAQRYIGSILKEGFPDGDPVRMAYRLDIGHFHCENLRECNDPRETSRTVTGLLDQYVRLWNIGSPHFFANVPEVRKLKERGKIMYFYGNTPRVDVSLLEGVLWGWQGYRYEADGVCLWNATDWSSWDTDLPPNDPLRDGGGRFFGGSTIFYPGANFGYDGPLPTLRLKAMRRGFQDLEYLRLAESSGKADRTKLNRMADGLILGEDEYTNVKDQLSKLLSIHP